MIGIHRLIALLLTNAFVVIRRRYSYSSFEAITSGGRRSNDINPAKRNNCDDGCGKIIKKIGTTRRDIIIKTPNVAIAAFGMIPGTIIPGVTSAAAPIESKDTDSVKALLQRKIRPKPLKVLRRKLSQDFAVLLMRSSYNALDDIDVVGMDQFQRDFFLIRASEYETYKSNLGPGMVQQGDLTDPYYFDFISFVQYKTINREIKNNPLFVFEEQQIVPPENKASSSSLSQDEERNDTAAPAVFVPVVVKRDPNLTNKMLIPTHESKVGATILDKLDEIFQSSDSKIPNISYRPDSSILLPAIRQIVTLFLINGYAYNGKVVEDNDSSSAAKFVIILTAPATLWGSKILQSEGDSLNNDFILKTVKEYLRRSGYNKITSLIKFNGPTEEVTITVN